MVILVNKVVSFNLRCSRLIPIYVEQRNSYGDLGKIRLIYKYTLMHGDSAYIVHVLYGLTIKEMEERIERGVLDSFLFDEFLRKTNSLANISG